MTRSMAILLEITAHKSKDIPTKRSKGRPIECEKCVVARIGEIIGNYCSILFVFTISVSIN
jgi:hypothetical protein